MFSGGELRATNQAAPDRSGVCKATRQTASSGQRFHRLRFDIDYVKATTQTEVKGLHRLRFGIDYIKATTKTEVKGLHRVRSDIDHVRVFGFQSEHR